MSLNELGIDLGPILMVMYVSCSLKCEVMELMRQVELKGVDYSSFKVPPCRQCEEERREKLGIVKPNVVFFVSHLPYSRVKEAHVQGETLTPENRDQSWVSPFKPYIS
jgi:NAD-dependent SIR2 family protein deacetylase